MKALVCGGRDFADWRLLQRTLTGLKERGLALVISGGARGADDLAVRWAHHERIPACVFPANWRFVGKAAGPVRNKAMLDFGKPDLVVAFPTPGAENKGTKDMVRQAREAGVEVIEATSVSGHPHKPHGQPSPE